MEKQQTFVHGINRKSKRDIERDNEKRKREEQERSVPSFPSLLFSPVLILNSAVLAALESLRGYLQSLQRSLKARGRPRVASQEEGSFEQEVRPYFLTLPL